MEGGYCMADKDKNSSEHQNLSTYMCLGIGIGTAIGVALNNMALWMSIGLSIGVCIGSVLDHNNQKQTEQKNDNEKME